MDALAENLLPGLAYAGVVYDGPVPEYVRDVPQGGRDLLAFNCAWGMDYAAEWEHLTLNLSPRVPAAPVSALSSAEVITAEDPDTGALLYRGLSR